MAKIDITRTELVWPGKYNDDGTRKEVPRVSLPFQVIETINHAELLRMTDELERPGAERLKALIELAALRRTAVRKLMQAMGLTAQGLWLSAPAGGTNGS